jgi:predicted nucleic acid-binding protein
MYLLDTNTIIYYLKAALPLKAMQLLHKVVDEQPIISIITKIELLGFNFLTKEEQNVTETFVNGSLILSIDERVAEHTIHLRKLHKIKIPDAIIAATAITFDLNIVTRNTNDFKGIKQLNFLDPHLL